MIGTGDLADPCETAHFIYERPLILSGMMQRKGPLYYTAVPGEQKTAPGSVAGGHGSALSLHEVNENFLLDLTVDAPKLIKGTRQCIH